MLETLVERVLLRRPSSPLARIFWTLFLVLGPLAYVGGSLLEQRGIRDTLPRITGDRDSSLATAQQFAAEHGLDTTGWKGYVSADPKKDLLEYYRIHRDSAAAAAESFSPSARVTVALVSPKNDLADVSLNRSGHVIGFNFSKIPSLRNAQGSGQDQALQIARASLDKVPGVWRLIDFGKPDFQPLETAKNCTRFTWHGRSPALPALSFQAVSAVCGTAVVEQTIDSSVESSYAKAHWERAAKPLKLLLVIYFLYVTVVIIYSIYRYARRAMEREVSHRRTLAVTCAVAAAMMVNYMVALDEYVLGLIRAGQGIMWFPMVAIGLGFLLVGLGVAVAYGAGEGDLRELYPGRMTSMDALMGGRILSRNVGRAALFGIAAGAWLSLAQGAADAVLRPDLAQTFGADLMKIPFFRFPLMSVFSSRVVLVTFIPAAGLLLPLAFLGRHVRRQRLSAVLIVLFAVLGSLVNAAKYGDVPGALVNMAVEAAALLAPFFGMDLLAVIMGLGTFEIAMSLSRLSVLSPSWLQMGATVGFIGLCFLVVEGWAALRGREYREEEVRPVYAGNIRQRQAMQAELAAAREAQLHLLPKSPPQVDGLVIEAGCVPARIVGGDFYDFFPLEAGKLGIFIAEGGNRGIGAAMHIALAKGFLMHAVRRNLSPREVLQRLEATLGPLLSGAGAATNVAYAIIDTSTGTLRWARTGDYPRVLGGSAITSEQKIDTPVAAAVLYEGSANLRDGDTVLLFTDGIARRVRTTGPKAADGIRKALLKRRRDHELEDDLTAILVRVLRVQKAMEVVA